MESLVSDASVLIDLEHGALLEDCFLLRYGFLRLMKSVNCSCRAVRSWASINRLYERNSPAEVCCSGHVRQLGLRADLALRGNPLGRGNCPGTRFGVEADTTEGCGREGRPGATRAPGKRTATTSAPFGRSRAGRQASLGSSKCSSARRAFRRFFTLCENHLAGEAEWAVPVWLRRWTVEPSPHLGHP